MERKFETPNLKTSYVRFGQIAAIMQEEMEQETDKLMKLQLADRAIASLNGMLKCSKQEVEDKRTDLLIDEHNRKFGTSIKRRNLELKPFDSLPE